MAEKFTKIVTDCETGVSLEVELTQEEIDVVLENRKQAQQALLEIEQQKKAQEEKRNSTLAKLAELGLSEEEINSIIS